MRVLSLHEIQPTVRIANYIDVTPQMNWSNRRIPDLEFILVVAGEYEYISGDQQYLLSTGDVLMSRGCQSKRPRKQLASRISSIFPEFSSRSWAMHRPMWSATVILAIGCRWLTEDGP
jgi:hypothetical protein